VSLKMKAILLTLVIITGIISMRDVFSNGKEKADADVLVSISNE
jgi:ABC-type uncharacterized transport system permease subunit